MILELVLAGTVRKKQTQGLQKPQTSHVVVVFFTLTDRASTMPSNIRGCQSGMVRGLLDRKRLEEHLPSSNESKIKTRTHKKRRREMNRNNNKIHRSEKDRRGVFDRESLV